MAGAPMLNGGEPTMPPPADGGWEPPVLETNTEPSLPPPGMAEPGMPPPGMAEPGMPPPELTSAPPPPQVGGWEGGVEMAQLRVCGQKMSQTVMKQVGAAVCVPSPLSVVPVCGRPYM